LKQRINIVPGAAWLVPELVQSNDSEMIATTGMGQDPA